MATQLAERTIPAHVPSDRVVDLNIYGLPGAETDPQNSWRSFKQHGKLVWSPYNGGHWVVTEGEAVHRFYRDPKHFSSAVVAIPHAEGDVLLPIQADPPVHAKYRSTVQALLTPSRVTKLDPRIRELTVGLIEGFHARGECEFLSEFALQLPLTIFLEMIGLPLDDRMMLRGHIEDFMFSLDPRDRMNAHLAIHRYLEKWVELRRKEPQEDGLTHVVNGTIDGRPYSNDEILSLLTLFLHAGLDTVAMALCFFVIHLARNPQDRDYIRRHPDRILAVIQELLRRYTITQLARKLTGDFEYDGVVMKKGDMVLLSPYYFNQDPVINPNPDVVDFDREGGRMMTFGAGPHTCAGALLARREIAVFLEEWLTRIPDFVIDPDRPPKMSVAQQNNVLELWLKWPVD